MLQYGNTNINMGLDELIHGPKRLLKFFKPLQIVSVSYPYSDIKETNMEYASPIVQNVYERML